MVADRDGRIDTLRGLACVLLVIFHVVGQDAHSGLRLPDDDLLRQVNDVLAYVRMPLFSLLSGYVYAWRPYTGGAGGFIRGKARRLLVPVLTVGTAFAVLQSVVPGTNGHVQAWHLLHIVPVSQYWFLQSLFCIFVVVLVLEQAGLLRTPIRFAGVFLAVVVLHHANPLPDHLGLAGMTYLLPYFMAGLWANRFGAMPSRMALLGAAGGVFALLGLAHWAGAAALPARNSGPALVLGLSSGLFLLRAGLRLGGLAWIGTHSFAIFLFNSMCAAASRIAWTSAWGQEVSTAVLLVSGVACALFGSIAIESLIRRGPPWALWAIGESASAASSAPATTAHARLSQEAVNLHRAAQSARPEVLGPGRREASELRGP
jgi:fucose 4-O-acetylase-like acetyltransferase